MQTTLYTSQCRWKVRPSRPLVSGQRESCRPRLRPWLIHWMSVIHKGLPCDKSCSATNVRTALTSMGRASQAEAPMPQTWRHAAVTYILGPQHRFIQKEMITAFNLPQGLARKCMDTCWKHLLATGKPVVSDCLKHFSIIVWASPRRK